MYLLSLSYKRTYGLRVYDIEHQHLGSLVSIVCCLGKNIIYAQVSAIFPIPILIIKKDMGK